jgi:formate--tetrahydrofolate ligase
VADVCEQEGAEFALSTVFADGGAGGVALAQKIIDACERPSHFAPLYELDISIEEKIATLARDIYGADGVDYTPEAKKALASVTALGGGSLPVCVAKTQYSLSDNPALLGRPINFKLNVRDLKLSAGAGFVVVFTGDILQMPGLPKAPAAENINIDDDGVISGLF